MRKIALGLAVSFIFMSSLCAEVLGEDKLSDWMKDHPEVSSQEGYSLVVNQVDSSNFPDIIAYTVVMDETGGFAYGLTGDQIKTFESETRELPIEISSKESPISVVLLIDSSGSMKDAMEETRKAAKIFIDLLKEEDNTAIIDFDSNVVLVQDFTNNKRKMKGAIDKLSSGGNTALYDALYEGISKACPLGGRKALVLLSDGKDEGGLFTGGSAHPFDEVILYAKSANIPIFSMGLGKGVDKEVLSKISEVSNAKAYFPPDVEALKETYRMIAAYLRSQYTVKYKTHNSTKDGTWRPVAITCEKNSHYAIGYNGYYAPFSPAEGKLRVIVGEGVEGVPFEVLAPGSLSPIGTYKTGEGDIDLHVGAYHIRVRSEFGEVIKEDIQIKNDELTVVNVNLPGGLLVLLKNYEGKDIAAYGWLRNETGEGIKTFTTGKTLALSAEEYLVDMDTKPKIKKKTVIKSGELTTVDLGKMGRLSVKALDEDGNIMKDVIVSVSSKAGDFSDGFFMGGTMDLFAGDYTVEARTVPHVKREVTILGGELTELDIGQLGAFMITVKDYEGKALKTSGSLMTLDGQIVESFGTWNKVRALAGLYKIKVSTKPVIEREIAIAPGKLVEVDLEMVGRLKVDSLDEESKKLTSILVVVKSEDNKTVESFHTCGERDIFPGNYTVEVHTVPHIERKVVIKAGELTELDLGRLGAIIVNLKSGASKGERVMASLWSSDGERRIESFYTGSKVKVVPGRYKLEVSTKPNSIWREINVEAGKLISIDL